MEKKKMLKNQEGFTLIEIISVLVILGILATVAVPKFFSLQEDARVKAAESAIAEVKARCSSEYATYLLRIGAPPTVAQVQAAVGAAPDVGVDFTVATAVSGTTEVTITVSEVDEVELATAATGTWRMPI